MRSRHRELATRFLGVLLCWVVSYIVYAETSTVPAGHPSVLGFLVALRLELLTLCHYMAETFARNLGLLPDGRIHWGGIKWSGPFWFAWLAVVASLHYLVVKKGCIIALAALTVILSVSSYDFKMTSVW